MKASPNAPVFVLRSAGVRYGAVGALHEVSLTIHAGERVALVGANGSGKSTLLRLLHGLVPAAAGDFASLAPARAQAMLFQRPHMLRASALSNVALAMWLRGTRWRDAQKWAMGALERVGLTQVARRNARTLSGGQQQRLALARAWALAPAVLLLDEPTASLDPTAKREVEALIGEVADGRTRVFASHNLGQVKRLATRVVYLEHGRVLADLPVDDFFHGALPKEALLFVKGELA